MSVTGQSGLSRDLQRMSPLSPKGLMPRYVKTAGLIHNLPEFLDQRPEPSLLILCVCYNSDGHVAFCDVRVSIC